MIEQGLILPPALLLLAGAFVLPLVPQKARSPVFLLFPASALAAIIPLPDGSLLRVTVLHMDLVLVHADALSRLFGMIFAFITLAGGVFAYHERDLGQQMAGLAYGAGAVGVTFAGDWITLFVFWELMAISSTVLVWARQTPESHRAGTRYLLVHLFGGSLLLAGILLSAGSGIPLTLGALTDRASALAWLMLGGVALNAAIPPLHAWLADAYPKATVTGAVFMSALTTKSAVYVLARVFAGWEILIILGVIMALYGVVYAVLANDIREILAYHIISQVGYMVAGVGIGTQLALNGAAAHAFSHILYKALLFMGAGVVLYTTGRSKLTELGGLYRRMRLTFWLYMIGAFSISGFPLFNGFISKSMVVSAAGESHLDSVYLLLTLASVGTFLHTGLKLPYFTWLGRESGSNPARVPVNMHVAMGMVALLCTLFGVIPGLLYRHLPFPADYEPYTVSHLVEAVQILVLTFVGFWLLRSKLAGEPLLALDTDWFYRRPAGFLQRTLVSGITRLFDSADRFVVQGVRQLSVFSKNPSVIIHRRKQGERFDPHRSRPPLGIALSLVLIALLLVALLSVQ